MAATNGTACDLELESAEGGLRHLRDLRGRVVVLFWETRERTTDNDLLKRELTRWTREGRSTRPVVTLAVGDVSAFDFAPARPLVRAATRAIARSVGIELWLDWRGALRNAPFSLVPGVSNVVVLDASGRLVLRRAGVLDARERAVVLDAVRQLAGGTADQTALAS